MAKKIDTRVCLAFDNYIEDRDKGFWYVKLSDGSFIYQDENRYSDHDVAWNRLKAYCKKNKLNVEDIYIRFRSHTEKILTNDGEGVFFRNKILAGFSSPNRFYFLFGVIKNGIIKVDHWMVPEIIYEETDERVIEGNEDGLLWNHKK